MDITPVIPTGRQVINGYGDGRFRINDVVWQQPVLVLPVLTSAWTPVEGGDVEAVLASLAALLDYRPAVEILLFGTGKRLVPLPPRLRVALSSRGVSADVMDTGAACRTYNVLLAEERRVAAALLPV